MIASRRIFLAAVIAPSLANAQGGTLSTATGARWVRVVGVDNAFTVDMPGIPDRKVLNDVSARGTPFTLTSDSLDEGGNSYLVQTALYPADVDTRQPKAVLQAALNARAQRLAGGKWSTVTWREIDGAAAVESVGALGNGAQLRQLSVLRQRRFVSLAFLGPRVTVPDADRFFASLKIK
jgi:hypothetical protein